MEAAAVKFALSKLSVVRNLGLELYHVSDEVRDMELKLSMIQGFLGDANSKRNKTPAVKQWVNNIRDVAYQIEDAIDTFLVDIQENRPRSFGVWSKLATSVKKPFKVKKLVDEMKAINSKLETISQLRIQLGITDDSGSTPQLDRKLELFRQEGPSGDADSEVVGLDRDKDEIICQLLDLTIRRRVVLSIVGMGGLGKTTLAQKVYNSNELKEHFPCRVWLSISQKFDVQNLLREILYKLEPNMRNENPTISQEDLLTKLRESLTQRRYLIVLDDVWTTDLWVRLRIGLPDGDKASRVLITTRRLDVARAADGDSRPYELRPLNEDESQTLLFHKANIPIGEPGVQHRTDLNDVARQLIEKCGGLPLALIVLGSILSGRDRTKDAWQSVHDTLYWHNDTSKWCSEVLLLSYVDLPYDLKPCFLYFASFPEDHQISAKHVMRMWIAEGFISGGRGTMEERAQDFLEELLRRSLVQVIEKSRKGNCKICGMHDLVRDMAIHEAREENFFSVFTKEDDDIQLSAQKVRRAMLQCSPPTNFGIHSKNARSLLIFGSYKYINNCGFSRLLKVLSIEGVHFGNMKFIHKSWLEGLIHLRYLGFRYCWLPFEFWSISVSNLKNLETVDFKKTFFSGPAGIHGKLQVLWQGNMFHSLWKLPSLRHIIIYCEPCPNFRHFPSKGDHLKNIQTLKFGMDIRERSSINERWKNLKAMLTITEHLISLAIKSYGYLPLLSEGTRDLSCHETIQSIYLFGKWERDLCPLNLEIFPTNVTKLTLLHSKFEEDPMPILERLQSLTILRLWNGSFEYQKIPLITCMEGGFPSLQKLELKDLYLSHWDIKEGAMPKLSHLKIFQVFLKGFPELQNVPMLRNLELDAIMYRESKQPENHNKIQHIASVRDISPY
ncbi:hypothetical protein LUZ63_003989 [Rhynchospora breviuscula]|uniref:Uncharacterized protein n=1 Tax=Rhynchospora breviuscula TaxID=2022672 RepID=A0A9Q0D2F7_9POAL|nr:hypothetical protein LUZ63_003989 [Rhynchospora breviuscula]